MVRPSILAPFVLYCAFTGLYFYAITNMVASAAIEQQQKPDAPSVNRQELRLKAAAKVDKINKSGKKWKVRKICYLGKCQTPFPLSLLLGCIEPTLCRAVQG